MEGDDGQVGEGQTGYRKKHLRVDFESLPTGHTAISFFLIYRR
jgi:hypothetical protein